MDLCRNVNRGKYGWSISYISNEQYTIKPTYIYIDLPLEVSVELDVSTVRGKVSTRRNTRRSAFKSWGSRGTPNNSWIFSPNEEGASEEET